MGHKQAAPETKGVSVELLATVDLGPEIEGMAGRELRMRKVTIEPGGVFGPLHDHRDRPGTVFILQGTITDHRNGVATDYGPGPGWPEDRTAVIDSPEAALDQAIAGAEGQLFALPTYTALLDLRNLLAQRGDSGRYWAS